MKSLMLSAASTAVVATLMLSGCASNQTATASGNPGKKTYTSDQLRQTGQPDTAGAAAAVDSSVNVSSGR